MEYEIKPKGKLTLGLKEVWEYRELFFFFAWRDIKVKYKQTVFGILWAVLQPFMLMIVFTFFFSKIVGAPSEIPYAVFVYSGLLLWSIFSTGLTGSANSMVSHANIIKKIYFPRLVIPMSSILVAMVDFVMAFLVYVGILIYYQHPVNLNILIYMPLAILITMLFTFGLGCFLAALNVKYRDFRYVVPFLVQFLFFLTPIIYPVTITDNPIVRAILSFNPMAGAIELLRSSLIGNEVNWISVYIAIGSSLAIFIIGLLYFKNTEHYFADVA